MVPSLVQPSLLSTLEMASGTHSIPAPGLSRQVHAETAVLHFSLPSLAPPIHAVVTHALRPEVRPPVSLTCISVTLDIFPQTTMKFGKTLLSLTMASFQVRAP